MAARWRLEERQQVVAPIEPVHERVDVLDVLGEAIAHGRRVAIGPPGRRPIEQRSELVAGHGAGSSGSGPMASASDALAFGLRLVGVRERFVCARQASMSWPAHGS